MELDQKIFSIRSNEDFESICLEVFRFQYNNCKVYREYCDSLGRHSVDKVKDIPFLPISFYKTHQVIREGAQAELIFKSSGTGGERSHHYVVDKALYQRSFSTFYKQYLGNPEEQVILALLPSYIEQGESSLIYMVDHLIDATKNELSGFFLHNYDELLDHYSKAVSNGKEVILFGVSYALLDIAERGVSMPEAIIIETGGMKGRRKEMTKHQLHLEIRKGIHPKSIRSEYGMTELLSQAYTSGSTLFSCPPWMQVFIREVNDPFSYEDEGKTGGINVIDLANIYSCSFIATEDLGRKTGNQFEVLGRFDNSDLRGCNLLLAQ